MPGPPQRTDDFAGTFPASPSVIADARRRFTAWLVRCDADADTVDDLAVVLSELMANAVRAADTATGDVRVIACLDGDEVVLEVQNPRTTWVEAERRWDLEDPLRGGGRGLVIVESLVDHLEVEHDSRAGTTTVRSRRTVAQRG